MKIYKVNILESNAARIEVEAEDEWEAEEKAREMYECGMIDMTDNSRLLEVP